MTATEEGKGELRTLRLGLWLRNAKMRDVRCGLIEMVVKRIQGTKTDHQRNLYGASMLSKTRPKKDDLTQTGVIGLLTKDGAESGRFSL